MNENIDKSIRDYAEGALPDNARREFERRLENDPELQADLDLFLVLKAREQQRLKKLLLQDAGQLTPVEPPGMGIRRPLWLAAAASLALLLIALWWWQQPDKKDALHVAQTRISTPYPPPVASMGTPDARPDALERAFLAYRNGDFAAAARQLTFLSAAPDASDETLFYTGEALLQTGDAAQATAYFERVGPGYWRDAAEWRCALAFLLDGRAEQAKPLLEKLRDGPRREQVEELLESME